MRNREPIKVNAERMKQILRAAIGYYVSHQENETAGTIMNLYKKLAGEPNNNSIWIIRELPF